MALGVGALAALVLRALGRRAWCECGELWPWSFDIWSRHNSQHLLDPYTLTHVLHGVVAYGLVRLVLGQHRPALRAVVAVVAEAAWEVLENTERVIEAYRAATISLQYHGDSIANSLGDLAVFVTGYLAASRLPAWASAAGFLAVEALLVLTIRDSLLLNLLMLLYPVAAVRAWQMGP